MKKRLQKTKSLVLSVLFSIVLILCGSAGYAQIAYIPNTLGGTVTVINVTKDSVVATIPCPYGPGAVAVSPDGTRVYVTNHDANIISVINTTTNTVSFTVPVGFGPNGIVVSPDGTKVYVTSHGNNRVSVINTTTNAVVDSIIVGLSPLGIAISPDGTKVFVTNRYGNTVSIISTSTNTVIATLAVGTEPWGIAVSPDGAKVYALNATDSTISVINTATNTVSATINLAGSITAACFSPDGARAFVTNTNNNYVSVINTVTNAVTDTIHCGLYPYGISITPDGSKIYVAAADVNSVNVINTTSYDVTASIAVGNKPYAFGNFISTYGTPAASALRFSTYGNHVIVPNSTTLNSQFGNNRITIEGWFKTGGTGATGSLPALVTEGYANDSKVKFALFFENGQFSAGFYENAWTKVSGGSFGVNFFLGDWVHFAATYDQTNITLYANGTELTSIAATQALPAGSDNWFLGKRWDGNDFYNGTMDDVRIWNVARTAVEIAANMDCEIPASTPGLVANYHFNQGLANINNAAITSLTDASGNGYNGTLTGFGLLGSGSNWVTPGGVVTLTTCAGFTTGIIPLTNEVGMLVYPNPATSALTVAVSLPEVQNVSVTLCNITGHVVKQIRVTANRNQIDLNVADLTAGLYFVIVQGKGWTKNAKVMIGQ